MSPPARQAVARQVLGMALVHKDARNATGARVQVLVRAPARKIHVPVVQLHWHIARCVGQIPTNNASLHVK